MAQRIEGDALYISCDFCGRDWNGADPVIEGHRGAIICLDCLKLALKELKVGEGEYACRLCLRDQIDPSVARWSHANHPDALACRGCVEQAADVFSKDPDIPWTR